MQRTFRKIIVGCNGQPAGQDALVLARLLAAHADADVLAIGVYPDPMLPFPTPSELRDECEALLRADRDALAPRARAEAIPSMSPSSALRHAVDREHADLLVLGSAAHAETGRVMPGRHARQLLHGSPCPVALAPRGYADADPELRRIVAGFDGSPEAAEALGCARALAVAAGERLRVVTAVDTMPPLIGFEAMVSLPGDWDRIAEIERRRARERLEAVLSGAPEVESEVVAGAPDQVLREESRHADLLVIGSRHRGPVARVALGGAAEQLVRTASCPLLVMPRSAVRADPARPEQTCVPP